MERDSTFRNPPHSKSKAFKGRVKPITFKVKGIKRSCDLKLPEELKPSVWIYEKDMGAEGKWKEPKPLNLTKKDKSYEGSFRPARPHTIQKYRIKVARYSDYKFIIESDGSFVNSSQAANPLLHINKHTGETPEFTGGAGDEIEINVVYVRNTFCVTGIVWRDVNRDGTRGWEDVNREKGEARMHTSRVGLLGIFVKFKAITANRSTKGYTDENGKYGPWTKERAAFFEKNENGRVQESKERFTVKVFFKEPYVPTTQINPTNSQKSRFDSDVLTERGQSQSLEVEPGEWYFIDAGLVPPDVYLLIGQSNMAGRADMDPNITQDAAPIANTWLLNNVTDAWVPAKNPLNRYSTYRKRDEMQKIGPGYGFSLRMQEVVPGRQVGLVVQARGGTDVSSWQKGSSYGYYDNAVAKTQEAMESGTLRAVLWHQGESDSSRTHTYLSSIKTLVEDLRADFGMRNLPFIAGQCLCVTDKYDSFNNMIIDLPGLVNYTAVVVTDDTMGSDDGTHWDRAAQLELGRRYAEKVLSLVPH